MTTVYTKNSQSSYGATTLLGEADPDLFYGALGDDATKIWGMGQGAFQIGPVSELLNLEPDANPEKGASHALVSPAQIMSFANYQAALAATRDQWTIYEKRDPDCPHCRRSKSV